MNALRVTVEPDPQPCPTCFAPMPCQHTPDVWVGNNGDGFYNATENARLAGLGLVPLASRERSTMTVATPKKPAKAKSVWFAGMSKTALRKKLLETKTLSDGSWKAYREEHALPEREDGESREAFIKRVLA